MCVFLSLRADKASLQKRFDAKFVEEESYRPTYVQNAFEFSKWPVICIDRPDEIRMLNWGLIPAWVKDRQAARKIRSTTVNARAETIFEKPAFRSAAVDRHCMVLVDGFFEYRDFHDKKYPYYIRFRNGRPFALAGLYEYWKDTETSEVISGFSIITTSANPLLEVIHNSKKRMPVILPETKERDWLKPGKQFFSLLKPFPDIEMEAWTVSKRISDRKSGQTQPSIFNQVRYPELEQIQPQQGFLF
jgi:putative SOS response-associated peptidase YedK